MWPASLIRTRYRRILLIIIVIALVYILTNLLSQNGLFSTLQHEDFTPRRTRPLIWRSLQEHIFTDDGLNSTDNFTLDCRNSEQGLDIIVDDRGNVCVRQDILTTGCCNGTNYFSCNTCNVTLHCCGVYEYCVSCCLHPSKRPLLELVLRTITGRQAIIYASVKDNFELCLVKCRTNSHSVVHENKYRNLEAKYCYGQTEAHESQREVLNTATH